MIASLRYLNRNRHFAGKILTAEDLQLEQEYFREKLKLHNRHLHGFGVVFGLKVSKSAGGVLISPGLAIDCEGNEIVVAESLALSLPGPDNAGGTIFLSVSYAEKEVDALPAMPPDCLNGQTSRIEEVARAAFEKANANRGHRHFQGRWRACGKAHGLTIAKLRFSSGQWRMDRRHHRPLVK